MPTRVRSARTRRIDESPYLSKLTQSTRHKKGDNSGGRSRIAMKIRGFQAQERGASIGPLYTRFY
eukprot:scaffold33981_cov47-Attheya_sp.AAC.1